MTNCGRISDGLAPKKPITSRQPPNRNQSLRRLGRAPRPQLARGPTRRERRHVHPSTTSPVQHPTLSTTIPGRRWRSAGRRSCRPQRRTLPASSGSPSDPAAASANRLLVPCPPGVGPTARPRGRHETPARCRRTVEVTAHRGISSPTVSRHAPSVRRCLQAPLPNRPPSRGPLADTRPIGWCNRRAVRMRSGYGPTNWFRCAEFLRVADGVSRCSRPRSDW